MQAVAVMDNAAAMDTMPMLDTATVMDTAAAVDTIAVMDTAAVTDTDAVMDTIVVMDIASVMNTVTILDTVVVVVMNPNSKAPHVYISTYQYSTLAQLFIIIIYSWKVQIKYIADTRLQERNQEKHMVIWL